jgi:two-component system NtrC family sensor kinase
MEEPRIAPADSADRLLIVEDSETQALRLRHLLQESGFAAAWARSAEDALRQLNESLPALIIVDYHLPGIRGDELCRRIRMNVDTRSIPILMLTSEPAGEAETLGLESGADDFVRKTEDDDLLLMRVQALFRKSQASHVLGLGPGRFTTSRILVVDDSDTYREYVEMELKRAGYQVATAQTGAEALERLALEAFDAVVLDMVLPDMNGERMCRRFAEARRTPDRPFVILMLTGGEKQEEMNAVLAAGADDVVGKSREFEVIRARLGALLRRKLLHEENQRIAREFQAREAALLRERAEKEAAQARAGLADQLARANQELAAANRELKETQTQLVLSAKMASLGQLVAGVAHEINNPLAFVIGHHATVERNLERLWPEIEPRLPAALEPVLAKLRQRLGDMRAGLTRIEDLVVKLRTFARLDDGEIKTVDIEQGIESVLTLLQYKLGDRITVIRRYGPVKVVSCYPGPFNQVIMNLLSNAIDAIEGTGEVRITTGQSGPSFFLAIEDTGRGIPAQVRERIFEPFFTTKGVGEGTGLGLSISYGIIRRHNGHIEVKSTEGRGTEVIVRIPLEQPVARAT